MNIKIKANNVSCLLKDNYDKVYAALKSQLTSEADFIFTKRTPGAGFLQWELPGDGWTPLSQAEPLVKAQVEAEKQRCFERVYALFGNAQQMLAQQVLTVPNDDYIFYKATPSGGVQIKITAWAYRYPEKVGGGTITKDFGKKDGFQDVTISFVYDGEKLPLYDFKIDGFARKTTADGTLVLNTLPVGKQYTIEPSTSKTVTLTVTEGQSEFVVDVTVYVTVSVTVRKDHQPLADTPCQVSYNGKDHTLTTDANGRATVQVALDRNGSECSVSVGEQQQQKPLSTPVTTFEFDFESPKQPEPPKPKEPDEHEEQKEPDEPEKPIEEEPKEPETPKRRFKPFIRIVGEDGYIGRHYPIRVTIGGTTADYVSDADGVVWLPEVLEGQEMTVEDKLLADNVQHYTLDADQEEYIFHVPYKPTDGTNDIKVTVLDASGHPLRGATIFFSQEGHPNTIAYLNEEGTTYLSHGDYATQKPLSVVLTVGGEQYKPIVFELEDDEDEYVLQAVNKASTGSRLLEILLALAGLGGTYLAWGLTMHLLTL